MPAKQKQNRHNEESSISNSSEDEIAEFANEFDVKMNFDDMPKRNKLIKKKEVIKDRKKDNKIRQLQQELEELKKRQSNCPICHFHSQEDHIKKVSIEKNQCRMEEDNSKDQFSQNLSTLPTINMSLPLNMCQELEEKGWIFIGTMMIAMGSKVIGFNNMTQVFKILRESVDEIRRQMQHRKDCLSIDFFLLQQENLVTQQQGGLNLQGIRVQSVSRIDNFQQKPLLKVYQFMKEHASIN